MKNVVITHKRIKSLVQPAGGFGYLIGSKSADPTTDVYTQEPRLLLATTIGKLAYKPTVDELRIGSFNDPEKTIERMRANALAGIPNTGNASRQEGFELGFNLEPSEEDQRIEDSATVLTLGKRCFETFLPSEQGYLLVHGRKPSLHAHGLVYNSIGSTRTNEQMGYHPIAGVLGKAISMEMWEMMKIAREVEQWSNGLARSVWQIGYSIEESLAKMDEKTLAWMITNGLTMSPDQHRLIMWPVEAEVSKVVNLDRSWMTKWIEARTRSIKGAYGATGEPSKKQTIHKIVNEQKDHNEEMEQLRKELAEAKEALEARKEQRLETEAKVVAKAQELDTRIEIKPKVSCTDDTVYVPVKNITVKSLLFDVVHQPIKFKGNEKVAYEAKVKRNQESLRKQALAKNDPELAATMQAANEAHQELVEKMEAGVFDQDEYLAEADELRASSLAEANACLYGCDIHAGQNNLRKKVDRLPNEFLGGEVLAICGVEVLAFKELLTFWFEHNREQRALENPASQSASNKPKRELPAAMQDKVDAMKEFGKLLEDVNKVATKVWQKVLTKQLTKQYTNTLHR